jgi:hypothetical protein
MRPLLALVACMLVACTLAACGPRAAAPPPVDYGPPAAPIDPIACPAATLERFAARVGVTPAITTEQIVEAARIDKLPCRPRETDDACLSRARNQPTPPSYERTGITIASEITNVDFTYDLDGRRLTESAPSMDAMITKLKALAAQGHKVTIVRAESAADAGTRHAAIVYRGIGGRQRRIVTLTSRPEDASAAMGATEAAAERERIEIRSMALDEQQNLVVIATCGA